jgi:hypothetical protein
MVGIMCLCFPYSLAVQEILNDNVEILRKGFIPNLYTCQYLS